MPRALLYYLAQTWTADRYRPARRDAPARAASRACLAPAIPAHPRAPRGGGAPPAHRARRRPMTGIPPPNQAIVLDTPNCTGATSDPGFRPTATPGAAKPRQPDGTGQASAAATKERGNLR